MQAKLDTLIGIVTRLASDAMPAQPVLPDGITLPIETEEDLTKVELAISEDAAMKNCLVSRARTVVFG